MIFYTMAFSHSFFHNLIRGQELAITATGSDRSPWRRANKSTLLHYILGVQEAHLLNITNRKKKNGNT
jgi:hypothetical protein